MRRLGIDFGEARIGLAVLDEETGHCFPRDAVKRRSDAQAIGEILAVITEEGIEELLLGDPLNLDGTAGEASRRVHGFGARLERASKLPLRFLNEALTTREAAQRLREQGVDPRSRPGLVDSVAAQLLLEEDRAAAERKAPTLDGASA